MIAAMNVNIQSKSELVISLSQGASIHKHSGSIVYEVAAVYLRVFGGGRNIHLKKAPNEMIG